MQQESVPSIPVKLNASYCAAIWGRLIAGTRCVPYEIGNILNMSIKGVKRAPYPSEEQLVTDIAAALWRKRADEVIACAETAPADYGYPNRIAEVARTHLQDILDQSPTFRANTLINCGSAEIPDLVQSLATPATLQTAYKVCVETKNHVIDPSPALCILYPFVITRISLNQCLPLLQKHDAPHQLLLLRIFREGTPLFVKKAFNAYMQVIAPDKQIVKQFMNFLMLYGSRKLKSMLPQFAKENRIQPAWDMPLNTATSQR